MPEGPDISSILGTGYCPLCRRRMRYTWLNACIVCRRSKVDYRGMEGGREAAFCVGNKMLFRRNALRSLRHFSFCWRADLSSRFTLSRRTFSMYSIKVTRKGQQSDHHLITLSEECSL